MRIGGLASGMDIDTIVGDLMKAERIPLDKLAQKKTTLEWQRDDYRSMNKLLTDLDRFVLDGIALQGTFNKKTVTSTNPNAVTATAAGSASNITSKINVTKLATARTWVSEQVKDKDDNKPSGKTTLETMNPTLGTAEIPLEIKVTKPDGTEVTKTIKIDPTKDTLESTAKKFSEAGLEMSAFYDDFTGKFVISNNLTGKGSKITLGNDTTVSFFKNIGFASVLPGATGPQELGGTDTSQNAIFDLNGLTGLERTSNNFTISGVSYSLKALGESTISSTTDTEGVITSIKDFVKKYNETIEAINKKTAETKYRDFPPLTDAQRKDLSEKEAELWDEKAKSGMLRGDSILSSGLNTMRSVLYASVNTGDTKYDQLSEIGITTSRNYLDKGKLEIDDKKLREALAANPEAVMKMFTGDSTNNVEGIAKKLRASIDQTVDKIELKAGNALRTNAQFTLGKELTDVDKRISAFEDRLKQVEDRYWRQFSAMESAIQRSNQQSMYLMQQFGGGQ
ncbi:flagellar hook-associated protein 2 [Fictibacillus sp. 26RED30]|uniref:flagellar hook-associated protein 2 n=1 Tax=Fictibacillus sp. 26RED30 TaxID=2745877 RepID=UPI0018CCC683|nr:flagellar hook-associated protein 2 [Fictibacillus sp. 26RED30]MBH0159176.1 flagellar hook-associated protein 2 [Fictibacillus sp. 26RED30]